MKKRAKAPAVAVLMTMVVGVAILSALVFPASAAEPANNGHWVDNLGAGVTASEFSRGNERLECESLGFTSSEVDLWVFEVRGATDITSSPIWDASVPSWTSSQPVSVRDVSRDYESPQPDPKTKRLVIETTPPGARLNAAHLLYPGGSTSEVLLFTCAHELDVRLRSPLVPSYDLSYRWTIDTDVEWKATDPYTYDISYSATRNRADRPEVQAGSAHVTGALEFGQPDLPVRSVEVSYLTGNARENCFVDMNGLSFDCSIDVSLLATDPETGRPVDVGSVTVNATTEFGTIRRTFPVDWRTIEPTNIFRTSAMIRNHAAMLSHKEVTVSKYSTINFFQETWEPGADYCGTRYQVFDLLAEPATSATPEDQTTTAVTWCRPRPGYSIQYLGSPYGIPLLIANVARIQQDYPKVLGGLPALTNRDEVRTFLSSLACLKSCTPLLRAQFLTTAFNALDPAFAGQTILIGETCLTVSDFLAQIDDEFPNLNATDTVIRKADLERINGALVTTCPTVATSTNSPTDAANG